jgi:hypothetical protein
MNTNIKKYHVVVMTLAKWFQIPNSNFNKSFTKLIKPSYKNLNEIDEFWKLNSPIASATIELESVTPVLEG